MIAIAIEIVVLVIERCRRVVAHELGHVGLDFGLEHSGPKLEPLG